MTYSYQVEHSWSDATEVSTSTPGGAFVQLRLPNDPAAPSSVTGYARGMSHETAAGVAASALIQGF